MNKKSIWEVKSVASRWLPLLPSGLGGADAVHAQHGERKYRAAPGRPSAQSDLWELGGLAKFAFRERRGRNRAPAA